MATDLFRGLKSWMYDIDILPTIYSEEEAAAEYIRLARIANRRIQKIRESADFGESKTAKHNFFVETPEFRSDRQTYAALQNVATFVARKTSTLSGLRKAEKRQLEDLQKKGYDWLNESNIHEFGKFWEEVRKHAGKKLNYDSERVAKLFREAKRKRISSKDLARDFEFWLDHEQELDTMKRSNKTMTSDQAKERIKDQG